jgi:single-strand DNA-binding protein
MLRKGNLLCPEVFHKQNIHFFLTFNLSAMNTLRNKVQLIGNLGTNPEIRSFDNGKTVARFSLATTDSYQDATGKKISETQWHNLVAWGGLAKIIEKYLTKGSEVAVEGKLTHRTYEDKDGNKKYFTEIVLHDMVMLHTRNNKEE